jgi:hypothetical protein
MNPADQLRRRNSPSVIEGRPIGPERDDPWIRVLHLPELLLAHRAGLVRARGV